MNIKRFALVICALLVLCLSAIAKVETWRQDSASAFAKGKKERVVVSDTGRVRLGRKVAPTSPLEATHVWDLAQTKGGVIYAATGSAGRVYRREGKDAWTVAHDADDSQALSVASLPDGRVFAGTGPTGKVIEVSDPKAQAVALDPSVKYVWDLVSDADGNLFAATGPTGQLWKRSPEGKWSVFFDSKYPHLLCLAVGNDGSVYAGSDGEGLIYKITKDGKPSVLYDAPQSEVRSLLLGPDGSLFAATAAEAAGSGGSGGPGTERGFSVSSNESNASGNTANRVLVAQNPAVRPGGAEPAANPVGGTAMPRPGPPGENAVYRIGADGAPREIFKTRALFYSLALSEDRLLVGTGPEGLIYEVRDLGGESSPIAPRRSSHDGEIAFPPGAGDGKNHKHQT